MDNIFVAKPVHVETITLRRKAEPKQEPPPRKGRRVIPFVEKGTAESYKARAKVHM